jgi:hypothetical protein
MKALVAVKRVIDYNVKPRVKADGTGGDHFIVLGKVHWLDAAHSRKPLLFFQGTYGGFT